MVGEKMDKPRHPQVIRTWKVERIRKVGDVPDLEKIKPVTSPALVFAIDPWRFGCYGLDRYGPYSPTGAAAQSSGHVRR